MQSTDSHYLIYVWCISSGHPGSLSRWWNALTANYRPGFCPKVLMVRDLVQAVSKQAQPREPCKAPGATAPQCSPVSWSRFPPVPSPSPLIEAWTHHRGHTHTASDVWSLSTANWTDKTTALPTGPGKAIGSEGSFLPEVIDSLVIL